jgi:hypothetical protein
MAPEQKTEKFILRMGPTELKMLQELSDKTGLTKADVVRQLIRREHTELKEAWLPRIHGPVTPPPRTVRRPPKGSKPKR